jgi:uncharacterized damage-inducible protein DinB
VDLAAQLLETWAIHDRLHRYLLDSLEPAQLAAKAGGKGRSVGAQLAHVHNVRLMWLKSAAPELLAGLEKLEEPSRAEKAVLASALEASGRAIGSLLERALAEGGKVKGFKPHAAAFVGYLVSHESHHRGQIALQLKLAEAPLSKKVGFGLWEWGVR